MKPQRKLSYDVIRGTAILMVVMIHTAGIFIRDNLPPSAGFALGNLCDSLSRAGVPLFLMLSGALMLDEDRQMDAGKLWKHLRGILLLRVGWSLCYAAENQLLLPLLYGQDPSLHRFLKAAVVGHYHLWYLDTLLGLYLLTPVLRLFVRRANRRYVGYAVLLAAVLQFPLPLLNLLESRILGGNTLELLADRFHLGYLEPFLAYYLLGWLLSQEALPVRKRRAMYALGAAGLAVTLAGTWLLRTADFRSDAVFYSERSLNVLLYSAAVFVLLMERFRGSCTDPRRHRGLAGLSGASFGIYAVHIAVLELLERMLPAPIPALWLPVLWAAVLGLSWGLTGLAARIPGLKRLFRY